VTYAVHEGAAVFIVHAADAEWSFTADRMEFIAPDRGAGAGFDVVLLR
jgi:hypothetical protein